MTAQTSPPRFRSRWAIRFAVGVAMSGLLLGPVAGWNEKGHKVVAFIAFQHLTTSAKAEVDRLLRLNPQFDNWMENLPPTISDASKVQAAFLEAANRPDFIKGTHTFDGHRSPETPQASQNIGYKDPFQHRYWHFINMPFTDDGTDTEDPPSVNARTRIETFGKTLASSAASDGVKMQRLMNVAHEMNQPHEVVVLNPTYRSPITIAFSFSGMPRTASPEDAALKHKSLCLKTLRASARAASNRKARPSSVYSGLLNRCLYLRSTLGN